MKMNTWHRKLAVALSVITIGAGALVQTPAMAGGVAQSGDCETFDLCGWTCPSAEPSICVGVADWWFSDCEDTPEYWWEPDGDECPWREVTCCWETGGCDTDDYFTRTCKFVGEHNR